MIYMKSLIAIMIVKKWVKNVCDLTYYSVLFLKKCTTSLIKYRLFKIISDFEITNYFVNLFRFFLAGFDRIFRFLVKTTPYLIKEKVEYF